MTQASKWGARARRSLDYQKLVAQVAASFIRERPLPWKYVKLTAYLYLKAKPNGDLPGNRGDWDNMAKAVQDGLQHADVFGDDRCVIKGHIEVLPCATAADERAEITLEETTTQRSA